MKSKTQAAPRNKRIRKQAKSKARALHTLNVPRIRIITPIEIASPAMLAACATACYRAALSTSIPVAHG